MCGVSEPFLPPSLPPSTRTLVPFLSGTPYEMGYAHGELMTEKAQGLMNDVWAYLEEQVVSTTLIISLSWASSFRTCELAFVCHFRNIHIDMNED